MKLLTGKTAIMAAITAVAASGKKWENDVQVVALSTIAHVEKHRECSLMDSLLEALPNGARSNALKAYFDKFSQGTFIEAEGKKKAHFAFDRDKKTDMDGAAKTTWAAFKPEPEYKPMDLCQLLENLVKRAKADKKTEYDAGLLNGIEALVATQKTETETVAPLPETA